MSILLTLWKREWTAQLRAPSMYVVWMFFLWLTGLSFWMMLQVLRQGPSSSGMAQLLFGESLFYWLAQLMVVPVLTMRLFAEERKSGTFEALMTAPIGDAQVVWAKFLGALSFYVLLWLPTLVPIRLLAQYAPHDAPVEMPIYATTYAGILCAGSLFIAIGLLASAMTRSQPAAAMMTLVTLALIFFAGFIPYFAQSPWLQAVSRHTSVVLHMMDFSSGILDSRTLIFYLSSTLWVLFLAIKIIEARKWNG